MTGNRSFKTAVIVALGIYLVVGALLLASAPSGKEGGVSFTAGMIERGWMAWTLSTALFFYVIAGLLITMTLLAIRFPETPRVGILRIETTRGDRLFISLLGSAFICLAWLATFGAPLWGALIVCLVYAAAVFRWV